MKLNYRYTWDSISLELKDEFPKYKVVEKETSKFMKFLNFFVRFFCPTFMTQFTTVQGYTVYMPKVYINTFVGAATLVHERQHMRDHKRWWYLYDISYVLFLPAGLTMRAMWEWRGYRESMRFLYAWFGEINQINRDSIVNEFTSSLYLWMWPFKGHMTSIVNKAAEEIPNEVDYSNVQGN